MARHPDTRGPITYQVQIEGRLDEDWSHWLEAVTIVCESDVTTLTGSVADQAALRGMLCKLWDLNLTLISVRRIAACAREEQENV